MFIFDNHNDQFNYSVYQSDHIQRNQAAFIKFAELAHKRFEFNFPNVSSTFFYRYYNLVPFTFGSVEYYEFYQNIKAVIRQHTNRTDPLWFQTWLNFHTQDEVLKRHTHNGSFCHGYVSIDPKHTETEFDGYTIKNRIGQLYIGPSDRFHSVNVLTPYADKRITIAFDVLDLECVKQAYRGYGMVDVNIGLLPVD